MRLDKKKRGFQLPHVIIILMCIMLAVTVMSFLIPSGEFVRDANGAVDPTQFSYVENDNPITFFDFFYDIPHGIVESADIIISIMVISGVLYVIEQTGAISADVAGLGAVRAVEHGHGVNAQLQLTALIEILIVLDVVDLCACVRGRGKAIGEQLLLSHEHSVFLCLSTPGRNYLNDH